MLEFENKKYTTISDIKDQFPISEKKIRKLIKDGVLPEPEEIRHGTRVFRHYPDAWTAKLAKIVNPRNGNGV